MASLVLRTCWMLWGYFPLMYFAKTIVYGKAGIFSFPDLGILINLLFIIIVRYVDLRYYEGKTGDGAPATMADFRSFALKTTGFFLFFWGILHYLAY
ncbi:MAG TPA: hypothetical protein PLV42_07690 [bacterium]|nr:hypothetical protein [bacterium]